MKPRHRVKAGSRTIADVVVLNTTTSLDIPPERVLDAARERELTSVVVLGWLPNGEEYFAASIASGPEVVWLLERAKLALLNITAADLPERADNPEGLVLAFPTKGDTP